MLALWLAFGLASAPLPVAALRAEGAEVRHSGLIVQAREVPGRKVLPEYWPFSVRVRNTTREVRTLHAEIVLSTAGSDSDSREVRCTVYRELQPQSGDEWVVQCRSPVRYQRWSLEIRKIWTFIP